MLTTAVAGLVAFAFTALMTIAGLGTAFIMIPVFLALGVELHTAMAAALLLNTVSMTVASVTFIRKRLVVWNVTVPIMASAVVLSPVGVRVSHHLDRDSLLWLFSGFLLFAASMMLFHAPRDRPQLGGTRTVLGIGIGVGGAAGFLGGLLGIGGGNIIVPSLVTLGLPVKNVAASSAFVVAFASLTGFLSHLALARMHYPLLAATTAGAIGGASLGSWIMIDRLKGRQTKILIGLLLFAVAVKIIWSLL